MGITEVCDSAGDLVDQSDEEPGGSAFDGPFEVFGKAPVPVQPGDCPLDHPASRQRLEAFGGVGALDDFQRPCADFGECGAEFVPGIAPIGEDVAQPREAVTDAGEHIGRAAVAILNIGGVNDGPDEQSLRVGEDMTLAALDLLAGVEASRTAAFRRFHALTIDDAALEEAFRPTALRAISNSA